MTDTPESLQAALDDLTRRVAAFEKAQKAEEEEPPTLTEEEWEMLAKEYHPSIPSSMNRMQCNAAARLRWCEAELARLREGLQAQPEDECDENVEYWANDPRASTDSKHYGILRAQSFAREIQRHRLLLKPGGGK